MNLSTRLTTKYKDHRLILKIITQATENQETFNQNWVIYAPVLPSLDVVPVSMAPSLEQNHNALLPVNASVVLYSTHQLTGLET